MPTKWFLSLTLLCSGVYAQNVAYVANQLSASVGVIDGATNTVVKTIPVGGAPVHLAFSPDATRLYAGLGSQNPAETKLVVIDVGTNSVLDMVPVPFSPGSMVITPDGSHAWVIKDNNTNSVALVNLTTKLIEADVATGNFPIEVNISPDGTRLYVSNNSASNVSVIDTATRSTVAVIPSGGSPSGLVLNSTGDRLWIVNQAGRVTVVETSSNSMLTNIPVPLGAYSGDLSVDGSRLYVGHAGSSSGMSVIDAVSNTLITTVPVANLQVWTVGVTEDGSRVFGSLPGGNAVAVFDANTNTLITTVPVGSFPFVLAVPRHKRPVPAAGLSTRALSFGKQLIGSTSAAQTVVLTNTGTAPLLISGITATGPFAQTNQCGASLALGASCAIAVRFSPLTIGPQDGAITITDNASPPTQTITLSGLGKGVFEAESGANSLSGPARVESCAGCSGGSMVTHLGSNENGRITFNGITASTAQSYTLSVAYLNGSNATRSLSLSVNGGASIPVSFPPTGNWDGIPASVNVQISLPAGNSTVLFSNASSPGPNLDQITIQ
jgi:YVTN family beta-propeller protein